MHLELKFCGVSILNNSTILSKKKKKKSAQCWLCCSINVPVCTEVGGGGQGVRGGAVGLGVFV